MWTGLIIGSGILLIIRKLPIRWQLRLTTHEVTSDVALFIVVNMIHGGTGEGVVHAAVAAGMLSVYTSWLRKRIGYWGLDGYEPGKTNASPEL